MSDFKREKHNRMKSKTAICAASITLILLSIHLTTKHKREKFESCEKRNMVSDIVVIDETKSKIILQCKKRK